MVAPWQETPDKVVVEFKRSGRGARRVIELTHIAGVLPPQLAARGVLPATWDALMQDVAALAASHPYTAKPGGQQMAKWAGCFCLLSVIGFGVVEPDAGDWSVWLQQAEAVVARHQAEFARYGVALSLARAQGSYWVQADCASAVAPAVVGVPMVKGV
jgi:hypothetical protein